MEKLEAVFGREGSLTPESVQSQTLPARFYTYARLSVRPVRSSGKSYPRYNFVPSAVIDFKPDLKMEVVNKSLSRFIGNFRWVDESWRMLGDIVSDEEGD